VRELSTQLTNEASLDFTINNDVAISISKRAQREEETLGREQEIGTHLEGHECSWNHPATKERATALGRLRIEKYELYIGMNRGRFVYLYFKGCEEVPEDTAAAIQNSLRDQAHQPDAAAAVDQIDPPRHLQNHGIPP
jgi:hypothetical protein